jgi:hypothetical protein
VVGSVVDSSQGAVAGAKVALMHSGDGCDDGACDRRSWTVSHASAPHRRILDLDRGGRL